MRVTIRTDASVAIGSGHAMRCLTLARALRDQGARVEFASRPLDGNLCDFIESCGFAMHRLPGAMAVDWERDADETRHAVNAVQDWLVVDHYGLDADWERQMRGCARRILVIDDLANRRHDCDILLDQNYYPRPQARYDGQVPPSCRLLLGPRYVLLAPQFEKEALSPRMRDGKLRRVLVFFGGSDPTRETEKALDAIKILDWSNVHFDVVVGASNPWQDLIQFRCGQSPDTTYYCQTPDMARLCSLADVALGAGGSAIWERSILGLPSIVVVTADNQLETVNALEAGGYIRLLGRHDEIDAGRMAEVLNQMSKQPTVLMQMGERVRDLMQSGAEGGAQAVVQLMSHLLQGEGMTSEVRKSEYGFFELVEKPAPDALKAYYAEKYYQDAEGSYEVSYSDAEKSYFRNKIAQKLLAASRYISLPADRPPRFLDVGAGEGWALAYFRDLGWECVGIDYSSFGCASQNPAVLEHLVAGDIYDSLRDLVAAGQRFDLILLDNVLEHVLDPAGLLVEFRGLLELQGGLIVEVPNDFSVLQEHLLEKGHIDSRFWVVSPDHISYFSPDSLAALARSVGWQPRMMMTDFPIDFSLVNPLTNYVRDRKAGKPCHTARVEMENLMHAISPEKTVALYQALADMGLGRVLTGVFSRGS